MFAALRQAPRAAGLGLILGGLMVLIAGPVTVATGSAAAYAGIDSCTFGFWSVGQGPASAYAGPSAILPRQNLTGAPISVASATSPDLWLTTESGANIRATTADPSTNSPDPAWTASSARTMYELWGTSLAFTYVGVDANGQSRCNIINAVVDFAANGVFYLPRMLTDATVKVKEFATGPPPLAAVYNSPDLIGTSVCPTENTGCHPDSTNPGVIENLRVALFVAGGTAALVITGIWVMAQARESAAAGGNGKRAITAGLLWTAVCLITVSSFLINGNWSKVTRVDTAVATMNSQIAEVIFTSTEGGGFPCALPSGAPNAGLRLSSCQIMNTTLFQPWAVGEFGQSANGPMSQTDYARPIWKETDVGGDGKPAKTYWQWAGCGSVDQQGALLLTDPSFWPWTSDDTRKLITDQTCFPHGSMDGAATDGCPLMMAMGENGCLDIRTTLLAIISSNPYDYVSVGQPGDGYNYTARTSLDQPQLVRTSDDAQRQLIAYTGYLGNGGALDQMVRGNSAIDRLGMAFLASALSLALFLMLGYLALLVLIWHTVTLLLIILLPIVGLIAAPPPGMKLGLWWLREFLSAFILRFIYGLLITIVIAAFQAAMGVDAPLGLKLLMLLLILGALIMMVKKVRSGAFTPTIGGEKAAMGNQASSMALIAGGVAVYGGAKLAKKSSRVAFSSGRGGTRRGVVTTAANKVGLGRGRPGRGGGSDTSPRTAGPDTANGTPGSGRSHVRTVAAATERKPPTSRTEFSDSTSTSTTRSNGSPSTVVTTTHPDRSTSTVGTGRGVEVTSERDSDGNLRTTRSQTAPTPNRRVNSTTRSKSQLTVLTRGRFGAVRTASTYHGVGTLVWAGGRGEPPPKKKADTKAERRAEPPAAPPPPPPAEAPPPRRPGPRRPAPRRAAPAISRPRKVAGQDPRAGQPLPVQVTPKMGVAHPNNDPRRPGASPH